MIARRREVRRSPRWRRSPAAVWGGVCRPLVTGSCCCSTSEGCSIEDSAMIPRGSSSHGKRRRPETLLTRSEHASETSPPLPSNVRALGEIKRAFTKRSRGGKEIPRCMTVRRDLVDDHGADRRDFDALISLVKAIPAIVRSSIRWSARQSYVNAGVAARIQRNATGVLDVLRAVL